MKASEVTKAVRNGYAEIAKGSGSCCRNIGYSEEEIKAVPEGANLGLGCGNPVALASLKEGETVLDLGSGAGFDCFLAARKVGGNGRVIGVDMTAEMLDRARANAQKGGYENVEFRLGEIEHLPVADSSVDALISNCVINLSPDKEQVFREAFRVLKPGGRIMVSDIVLTRPLPEGIKKSIEAYIGCLSGALLKKEYLDCIARAGFEHVAIIDEAHFPVDDWALKAMPEPIEKGRLSVMSIRVSAAKPAPKGN